MKNDIDLFSASTGSRGVENAAGFNVDGADAGGGDGGGGGHRLQINVGQFYVFTGDFGAAVEQNCHFRDGGALYILEVNIANLHVRWLRICIETR